MVFYPAVPERETGKNEEVLQISDWRDERGRSIIRSLKRRTEWYAIKKKGVQSWGEAIAKRHFGDKVQMEWTRMPGADVSDVYYEKFLMHGQPVHIFEKYQKGDSIRLRIVPYNENHVIAPADGRIVVIEEVYEHEYYKEKRLQVSIFMSPFNVHVNRYPFSGVIKYLKYHPGLFLVAWNPKSSTENERTSVVLENSNAFLFYFGKLQEHWLNELFIILRKARVLSKATN